MLAGFLSHFTWPGAVLEHLRSAQYIYNLKKISSYLSLAVLVLGLLVLLGWGLGLPALTRLWPGWLPMSGSTAMGFALAGLALQAHARGGHAGLLVCRALGAFLVWLGCLKLLSAYVGIELSLNLWTHSKISLYSASSFVLVGLALLLLGSRWRRQSPSEWLGGAVALLATMALLGKAYHEPTPFLTGALSEVANHVAWGFLLVGAATMLAVTRHSVLLDLADVGPGGALARRVLPAAVILPMTVGLLSLLGEQSGLYNAESALIFSILAFIVAGFAFALWTVRATKKFGFALIQEEERLRVTLRSIGDGVIAVDLDMRVTMVNAVAEKLTGWPQDQALGRPLQEVFRFGPSVDGAPTENPMLKALRLDAAYELKEPFILVSRSGFRFLVADSSAPIHDAEDRMIGAVLVFRDVSAKQRLDQELLKLQKLESLAMLAGGIAHDFNNILSVILANVSLASLVKGDAQTACLRDAQAAVARGGQLAGQLMAFARGGSEVRKPIDLGSVVEEAVRFALTGTSSRASFDLGTEPVVVDADPGQISQLVQNLVLNASQAMPGGGLVHIAMEGLQVGSEDGLPLSEGRYHKIVVTDQGPGIKPEILERIFDPFFTTKLHGNGLGLASSHSIAKGHRGHLRAESVLGHGSAFSLYLPASVQSVPEPVASSQAMVLGQGHILVMDDDAGIMKATLRMLESLGYRAEGVGEGMSAVALAQKTLKRGDPFDAAILDLTIPGGMGGRETVKLLREKQPDLKVIVASGYSVDPVMKAPTEHGFAAAMPKPFSLHTMSQLLNSMLK